MLTIPDQISAQEDAAQAQFSTSDYGREGNQRPYQVVYPAYNAPQFLNTFMNLQDGLRECRTLCHLEGKPFRLMRWGARGGCRPCAQKIRDNRFGRLRLQSRGALAGYPDAQPVAEVHPTQGTTVFGPNGEELKVGGPNYIPSPTPIPPYDPGPIGQHYLEAVQSAQLLANRTGSTVYLCGSFGLPCKKGKKWLPVVYVQPGGIVRRYPYQEFSNIQGTVPGSTTISTNVSPEVFQELLRESQGASRLGQGA